MGVRALKSEKLGETSTETERVKSMEVGESR